MLKLLQDILTLPYLKGGYEDSPQETEIKRLLCKHGFTEIEKNSILLPQSNHFIFQPNGNNNSPDFLVCYEGKNYPLECKSVKKGGKPVYNGCLPVEDYIYIFCSNQYNQTTIYFGKDIVSPEVREIYGRLLEKLNGVLEEFTEEFIDCKQNKRGFGYFIRHMYIQAGKAEKTNYFTHKDRKDCEENVLDTFR